MPSADSRQDHELVFVYGSLRRGQSHARLLDPAQYLGTHVTAPDFSLYDLGEYPAAVAQGQGRLSGEVYLVDPETLQELDEYEECPPVYVRRKIPTPWGEAWIYLMPAPPQGARLLAS